MTSDAISPLSFASWRASCDTAPRTKSVEGGPSCSGGCYFDPLSDPNYGTAAPRRRASASGRTSIHSVPTVGDAVESPPQESDVSSRLELSGRVSDRFGAKPEAADFGNGLPLSAPKLTLNTTERCGLYRQRRSGPRRRSAPPLLMLQALKDDLCGDRGANGCAPHGPEKHPVDLQPAEYPLIPHRGS